MQIGIAGIGRMGAAIGARLMEVGHALSIWNRSAEKLGAHDAVRQSVYWATRSPP
jgi:3-hydroxyisobutyrate dehydrogenase-like beta-hydroxyacid dehydrogenase